MTIVKLGKYGVDAKEMRRVYTFARYPTSSAVDKMSNFWLQGIEKGGRKSDAQQ